MRSKMSFVLEEKEDGEESFCDFYPTTHFCIASQQCKLLSIQKILMISIIWRL
jgi:hypothetical protein